MSANLLTDCWLPIEYTHHASATISVAQCSQPDILAIQAPRADFKGALYQWLIGLLQTTFAPENRREWLAYWKEPPTQAVLQAAFAPYIEAFNLQSERGKPAFMQDLLLDEGPEHPVSGLVIESPGGNTLKLNQDIFVKRGGIKQMSPYWAAMALFTLQINAPSGGQGHRVSLRGGGPLTTLLLPPKDSTFNTLWHTLWLNILTQEEVSQHMEGNEALEGLQGILPWMGETRVSKENGAETYPHHGHPLQAYWSMPRRIRLEWSKEQGGCDISGTLSEPCVKHFKMQNYGVNYAGSWLHPLTPYVFETGKAPYSIKAQPGGLGYRHWLELAATYKKGKQVRTSALVVEQCYPLRRQWLQRVMPEQSFSFQPRLWAFGFDMDNMKARCWYEATLPLFNLDGVAQDDMQDVVRDMIEAAVDVLGTLKSALKTAWFREPKKNPATKKFSEKTAGIDSHFWSHTEPMFYRVLEKQVAALQTTKTKDKASLLVWRRDLRRAVMELFEWYALRHDNEDGDYARLIKARHGKNGLEHYLNGSKALKKLVI